MNWLFYLDDTLIDEPVGFADISLRIKRDEQWHGIFFEATTNDLKFYGAAADYLMDKKRNEGFQAEVIFKAVVDCGEPDEIFEGRLDFRQYKEQCGATCFVTIPVEQQGCTMTLRNRYDQKVDLSEPKAFDKQTILPTYDGLNFAMELAAQRLQLIDRAELTESTNVDVLTDPGWVPTTGDDFNGTISVPLDNIVFSSFGTFQTSPIGGVTEEGDSFHPPFPADPDFPTTVGTATLIGDIACELTDVTATFRIKGSIQIQQSGVGATQTFALKLFRLPEGLDATVPGNWITSYSNIFYSMNSDGSVAFDVSGTVALPFTQGDFLYWGINAINPDMSNITELNITFLPDTFFELAGGAACEPTDCVVSLIHETASRITEAITDRCLTVKSDYYGRTDSEPYAATEDGCGSLRVLSNGLRIRNAETQNHFLSLKELFESLNPIDNIGMGIEPTGVYDLEYLRIEPVEYFYEDVEIIRHPNIPTGEKPTLPDQAYSVIKVGYKKWEAENVNGLDEFNSNKEFRTSLKSINNTLDITSGFIAGGYPTERTRQQSYADTGAADTKYDNDTFIVCVTRAPYAYGNYIVEQGNIGNGANMYSPATAYNWRIRPMYNLIRWWKSIAQSYVNLINTTSKLLFTSGTGNLLAVGELAAYDPCKVEARLLAENDDLARTDIAVGEDPIWKPDGFTYRYPMSLRDYNTIKANPKGYLAVQCGNGDFQKGFIMNINYRIAKGDADITLKLKWGT